MPSRRGRGPLPRILDFAFDDENEDKVAAHGLTIDQVAEVLDNRNVVKPNRRRRRAAWLVIGRDAAGQCIAVPVEPTHDSNIWRPVTAWRCKSHEEAWLA